MASAASSGHSLWSRFRTQAWPVQFVVWIFALPVPVWLWAAARTSNRAPALALAGVVTFACVGVPIASGLSGRESAARPRPPADTREPADPGTTDAPVRTEPESTTTNSVTTSTTSTTTSTPVSWPPAGQVAPRTIADAATPAELLSRVRVRDETSDSGYDSELFPTWTDEDGDGCDTRCEVLDSERLASVPGLAGGGWISFYDGAATDDPSTLDIDHVVALGEAWRSGASTWGTPSREAFANDLADPRSLTAVSDASNRSKSDTDPSGWRPDDPGDWCRYVTDWMAVKLRWDLAVDPIEFAALQNITDTC